jgi:hypothetical protein
MEYTQHNSTMQLKFQESKTRTFQPTLGSTIADGREPRCSTSLFHGMENLSSRRNPCGFLPADASAFFFHRVMQKL